MTSTKSFEEIISERKRSIVDCLDTLFPSDIIKIINEYYEYLQGNSYSIDHSKLLSHIIICDKKIVGIEYKRLHIWDSHSGKCESCISVEETSCITALPNGLIVIVPKINDGIVTLNLDTEIPEYIYMPNFVNVTCISAFSDNDKIYLVSGSSDGILEIWNLETKKCITSIVGHLTGITSVVVLPDKKIVTASCDSTLKIWDLQKTENCISILMGHSAPVMYVTVLSDGRIASASNDGTLKIWNLQNEKCDITCKRCCHFAHEIAILPDGRIITGSSYGILEIWDPHTGNCDISFRTNLCNCFAVFPDGRIATSSYVDKLKIWS